MRTWRSAWPEFTPHLAFPPARRTVVYSTNMVEIDQLAAPQGQPQPWSLPLGTGRVEGPLPRHP
ncbi:hypothetical protein AB0N09_43445 [Streptomyces erythrochromogenes]